MSKVSTCDDGLYIDFAMPGHLPKYCKIEEGLPKSTKQSLRICKFHINVTHSIATNSSSD